MSMQFEDVLKNGKLWAVVYDGDSIDSEGLLDYTRGV